MGAGIKIEDDDGINDINITPLVDVMLVLLIIFMVASIYIVKDAIEIDLPSAAKTSEVVETTLSIVIDRNGTMYLNGKYIDEPNLVGFIKTTAASNPNAQAIIAADSNVRHGAVIRAIDIVRSNGLTRFAMNVKRDNRGGQGAAN